MNMIERVARAIIRQDRLEYNGKNVDQAWLSENVDEYWHGYVDQARAAIEAMREPTEEMLQAEQGYSFRLDTVLGRAKARELHAAMIDAALEEGK